MYLSDWRIAKGKGRPLTYKEMAHRFGISDGTIVRRWMVDAHKKEFSFPSPEVILQVQESTLGEVTAVDFYSWYENTKTAKKAKSFHDERS